MEGTVNRGTAGLAGLVHRQQPDRLIFLLVTAALLALWAMAAAYAVAERSRIIERAQHQLAITAATLADLNELAELAAGGAAKADERRAAALWRVLLQYPTARVWFEQDGVVSAGTRPQGNLARFVVATESRQGFSVHTALPLDDALAGWRQAIWEGGGILATASLAFLLLGRFLTRALQQRAAAEERAAQLARYRSELERTVAQRTVELRQANDRLGTELTERKAAEAALRQHDGLLRAVARGAGELLGSHSFEDAAPVVLELIGQTIAVGRVQISAIGPDAAGHLHARVAYEWCASGAAAGVSQPALRDLDLTVQLPAVIAPLLSGKLVTLGTDDIAAPHRRALTAAGMRSLLLIPVLLDGRLWGCVAFIDADETRRQWSWAETDTLQTLVELIGVAIARAHYVKELADANMIVQNSPTILYRLAGEPSLPLIYISHNITKFGHDPATLVGSTDWAVRLVHPDDRQKIGAAMARALERDAQAASIEFRLMAGDGGYRWVDNRYTPVRDRNGRLVEVEGIIIDITERRAAEEKIALLARTDPLTGLANRATFIERLHQAFAATRRGASAFAILFLDLDHFKNINDTLGHPAGDRLLCEVAARLQQCTRESDLVARLGGDEFAVLQTEMSEPATAGILAGKIRSALAGPYLIDGNEVHVTTSVGISPFIAGIAGPDAMLAQADMALYRAKDEGRDRYCFHSRDLDDQMVARVTLSEDLRRAIDRDELELYYQPQVELSSGRIVGMEALVRWHHPTRGLLYPADFIAVAEKTGTVTALGQWVLDHACRQLAAWRKERVAPPVIAVNLSLAELKTGREFLRNVGATTERWGLSPGEIEFDVTEATLAQVTWTQNDVLVRLHQQGFGIAIDDFGTEYSSFDYLRAYRVNHVKLAQPFVLRAVEDPNRAATIRAIISLARELGITVIAEGVETREQRNLLIATGSTEAQGFYFSAPVDAARAGELLRAGSVRPNEARAPPSAG